MKNKLKTLQSINGARNFRIRILCAIRSFWRMRIYYKLNKMIITGRELIVRLMVICTLMVLSPSSAWGDAIENRETIIKAGFIYNFSKFIHWPSEVENHSSSFNLCVVGPNGIQNILSRLGEKRTIKSKKVNILNRLESDDLENCQILYISKDETHSINQIIAATQGKSVLTISNGRDMAKKGIGIAFVIVQNKMRFIVNRKAIEENGLTVSSELLDLAIFVHQ